MSVETNPHNYTNMDFIFSQIVAAKISVRPRKNTAEGGCGGNSAVFLQKIEASPATCLNTWKAEHHRKILFSLKEKEIRRAQNEKSKEYFFVVWRARRAVAGLASLLGVLLKKSSNINQKTPPSFGLRIKMADIRRDALAAHATDSVDKTNEERDWQYQHLLDLRSDLTSGH